MLVISRLGNLLIWLEALSLRRRNCHRLTDGVFELAACLHRLLQLIDGRVMLLQHMLNALRVLLLQLRQLRIHLIVLLRLLDHLLAELLNLMELLGNLLVLCLIHGSPPRLST